MFWGVAKAGAWFVAGPSNQTGFCATATAVTEDGNTVRAFCPPWHKHKSADDAAACPGDSQRLAGISGRMT